MLIGAVRDHPLRSRDQGGVRAQAHQIIAAENRPRTRNLQKEEEIDAGRGRTPVIVRGENVPTQGITRRNHEEIGRALGADRAQEKGTVRFFCLFLNYLMGHKINHK